MDKTHWREWLIGIIVVSVVAGVFSLPPIPQDPSYHHFADERTILGIPNFWNVLSNLPFLLVGLFGLIKYDRTGISVSRPAYLVFCIAVFLVGIGSAYYHYDPTPFTLVCDRLPMTLAFMGLFSLVVSDRISNRLGTAILSPLLVAGISSVGYWYWSEAQGTGDLRAYAIVQFLPMILIPLILMLYSARRIKSGFLWATLSTYVLAKLAEHFDVLIYSNVGIISGHSIKHVLGALAVLWVILSLRTHDQILKD